MAFRSGVMTMIVDRPTASTRPRCWRDSYPVLLACMIDGRRPSAGEIETVAARMLRELGRQRPGRIGGQGTLQERVLAAARVALEGEATAGFNYPGAPLVLRGH
jgi:hypothetical protein